MTKTVKVTIDGVEVQAEAGENLIQAAERAGKSIPYFCWHPRLSVAGQCRMCLVETSLPGPPGKLIPGCQQKVAEGMWVKTETPAVAEARRAGMEFHLTNHPVDCAICDQSGECKLQDYYQAYDEHAARYSVQKLTKPKRKVLGPLVTYDGERCILCTRCVRFMSEVAGEPQLAQTNRGDHSEIDIFPGRPLDSKYSGNTVDICPVGALLNRDFRFTSRVWYLEAVRSVCAGCANGCNVQVDFRGETVHRYLPRQNDAVNQVWLCDDGRVSYHSINDRRALECRLGRAAAPDATATADVEAAAARAAELLKPLAGTPALAALVSPCATTEELLAACLFAKEALGLKAVYAGGRHRGTGDDFLIREDKNPNAAGLKIAVAAFGLEVRPFDRLLEDADSGALKALWAAGTEVPADDTLVSAVLAGLEVFVAQSQNAGAVVDFADVVLPAASHVEQEGTFVNWYGRLQRFARAFAPRGRARPHWAWVGAMLRALGTTWRFRDGPDVFEQLKDRAEPLRALSFAKIPWDGVVLPGYAPKEWPRRAPRPSESTP